jgi:anti-sigma regulatory factor (Ser/Thr protein kinase)
MNGRMYDHIQQLITVGNHSGVSSGQITTCSQYDAMYHTYRSDLAQVRTLVLQHARQAGLPEDRANDLMLAVSEVAANTLRHTRSAGTLAIWSNADEIICEVHDQGTITDPEAGTHKPAPDASGGHGLWIVRKVCDLVELTSDGNGTTVRMHMALRPPRLGNVGNLGP